MQSTRCLYHSTIGNFLKEEPNLIFGKLDLNYHGDTNTNTKEAWVKEIAIMQEVLQFAMSQKLTTFVENGI